ncbi:MAG TPA: ATP-binding protein [Pseudonocardiaceae bacterium]|jgi:signal transduction histidine kinase|nr:ATP-binding protein [Pseudonocardiaceae bacterium]
MSADQPAAREQLPCDLAELRSLFLFEKLTDEQLDWLCRNGHVERFEPGYAYREGEPAAHFFVLLSGTITLSRRVGDEDVEVDRVDRPGVHAGASRSFLGDHIPDKYDNSLRVVTPARLYVLAAELFAEVVRDWFPMAMHLIEGMLSYLKDTQQRVSQRERLLALGSLSAGLTHELNNPAAAAVRATSSLRERVAGMRHKLGLIASGPYDRATLAMLIELQERVVEKVGTVEPLSPLAAADLEDELTDWFDAHGITNGWDMAPTFVQAGLGVDWLEQVVATAADQTTLEAMLRWLNYTIDTELLMTEIEDSITRVSTLVTAARQYSQLDRVPYQVIDVHELIDSTLLMLNRKIGDGITVVRQYDRTLPAVPVYAAELNQVWTNLIDNAADAMAGHGTLTVRTRRENDRLVVEIGDTGPGIPPEITGRIFEPFFTTKPVGAGTGLGLDISWRIVVNRHHGDLSVESAPGDTRFQVRLPLVAPRRDGDQLPPINVG